MKTFPSIAEFINYYNEIQTIPSTISITINDAVHEFKRTSHHNKDNISKSMVDNYTLVETENCGLSIELHVNYYRYFEAKAIVEAYMAFFHDEDVLYLHPLYFYNHFVTDAEFAPYIDAISNSLEKWTGLKWVNVNEAPNAFADIRNEAYCNIQKDLFYLLPTLINSSTDIELDSHTLDTLKEARKKKCLIDDHGQSRYFKKPFEVPEFW